MEEKKKNRGWVKDAAIIFLAVLLVLTFFSNTILNRSLPEVATVYVTDGTITSKVRGTGTVTARENYDVMIDQTRKVKSVLVRVGDEVSAGDVLFTLQPGDSDELADAERTLKELENAYQRDLLTATQADYARENREITYAKESLQEAQTARDEAQFTAEEKAEYEKKLAELMAEADRLAAEADKQQAEVEACRAGVDSVKDEKLRELELELRTLRDELAEKKKTQREKQSRVDDLQLDVDLANKELNEALEARNRFSEEDPNYAPVSAALAALNQARRDTEAAAQDKQVAQILYGEDYASLTRAATGLEYDYRVYAICDDVELHYRSDRGILPSEALTDEQQAEVEALAKPAVDALGPRDYYTAQELEVYLSAAAVLYADTSMVEGAEKLMAAEEALEICKRTERQREAEYRQEEEYYSDQLTEDSLYYKYSEAVIDAQKALDSANRPMTDAQAELDKANRAVEKVNQAMGDLQETMDRINSEELGDRQDALTRAEERLTSLRDLRDKAEAAMEELKGKQEAREQEYKDKVRAVRDAQDHLDDLLFNLEQQKKSDGRQQMLDAMDRKEKMDAIEAQRARVEELRGGDKSTDVTAKVAGKIKSITVSAGYKAEAGNVLATIEVPDLGYSMSFAVTVEQARRLRVGDSATVTNYYWGSQITATLVSIQTDPQNPQGSRILNFDVFGDVNAGNSLTVSVGERNANYDMVVPNSAVRSDTNGSFVLMITAKNSPLGNRYFAKRVNVEVIASDEKYSAISGAIDPYDSVITTASRNTPVANGDQVRLADSNAIR